MLGDTCIRCNTRLEKTCGECGFANPVEKNYCDQCGSVLAMQPPPKSGITSRDQAEPPPPPAGPKPGSFTLEMESISDTVSERANSFRRKPAETISRQPGSFPPPPPAAPVPPPPAAAPQPPAKPTDRPVGTSALLADSSRLPSQTGLPVSLRPSLMRKLLGPGITLLLVSVLLGILYMIAAPSLPRLRLVMTAKSYLTNISQGKFEKAYDLLSTNSQANCTLSEYIKNSKEYYAKAPPWSFKDVQVFTMDKDAAMIRYQLKDGDQPWKSDYISFVRENNRWARPYIWVLFQPIEDALKRQDFPHALFLSQKLYLTDPIDPRTSGYLCVSEFFMGLHAKSAESCKRTIESATAYPVGYTKEELFWFNAHYADSLRYLQKDRAALVEYDKLLNWPALASAELCSLHMNRADSYVNLKDYEKALQDVMKAEGLCATSPAKEDTKRRLSYMSGTAGNDAIAFAQKSRFQANMPPIAEARRLQLETLKSRLGPKNAKLLPKDQWVAVHVAGPEYRVFLRQENYNPQIRKTEKQDVFIFLINLWTDKAKVEKAPAPPPPLGAPRRE
jgi:tetratricopeptide (TPR) repeat protein